MRPHLFGKPLALAAWICAVAVFPLPAQSGTAFPRLEPDPRARELSRRVQPGIYSWQDLAEIALWASSASAGGSTGAGQTALAREMILGAAADLRASPALPANPRDRGEYILTFMHEKFLKSYATTQTRVDEIFSTGRYNCVSSAALYTILAVSAGLDVRGVMTRDHAFVTLNTGGELVDVETTNAYGFDPGSRREFSNAFGSVTGFSYVPARDYRDRVSISPVELISLILTNRIAELESRNRFGEAVPLALDRAALLAGRRDPVDSPFFSDPEKDLMDRIFNYGTSLVQAGREAEALAWADAAQGFYPRDARWPEFIYVALNNQLGKLLRGQQLAEARSLLTWYASRLNPGNLAQLDIQILGVELLQRINRLGGDETAEAVLRAVANAQGRGLPDNRAEELRTFVIIKEGERLTAEQGLPAAITYIEAAITRYGRYSRLEEILRIHRSNRVAALHNQFADFFNRQDYEAARQFIQAALEEFPGNRQLSSDLTTAEQALRRRR
jgi:tetratricopeptide (TPR) repeat protein